MTNGKIMMLALTALLAACNAPAPTGEQASPLNGPTAPVTTVKVSPDPVPGPVDGATKAQSAPPSQKHTNGDAAMLRSSFDECIKASGGVTPEMQSCIDAESEYQETRLSKAYQDWIQGAGDKKVELESEQKQWLSERDAQCRWDANTGGQAQRLEANGCFLEMTAKRAAELEAR